MRKRTRVASPQQIKILQLLQQQAAEIHGYDMMKATGLGPGTLYGLLKRLADDGFLDKTTEIVGGRCRIGYRLTLAGVQYAQRAVLEDEYEQGIKLEASDV
jgi:DNA-binding PadR family transcriptional regulator